MPAAAVIPAPIAYIKVVAVKKLVVGGETGRAGRPQGQTGCVASERGSGREIVRDLGVTLKKLECLKQARAWIR